VIGLLMPRREHLNLMLDFAPLSEFQRQVVLGVSQFCHERGDCRCRTATTESNMMEDADVIDGVIAIIERPDPKHRATRFGKPIVNVSTILFPVPFPTIAIDNQYLGRLAAEHLLTQGYRSFAYHMESRVYFSVQRGKGFQEAIHSARHRCALFDTGAHADASPAQLHAQTLRWLSDLPKPLGLFTHNDMRATVLVDLCHNAGMSVPNEIGVIGVDNDPLMTQLCQPNLSSIDTGAQLIGYRAAERLVDLIRGRKPGIEPVFLPAKGVVVRESTEPSRLRDERLAAALRYIRNHADQPVSVDDLLQRVPTSRRSLERLFRIHLDRSPAEEIRRVRINRIKWLLVESDRPLTEIALQSGFSSFRNFATAFRRDVGISASAYRKNFRAK
jgi:LacI family transcriptional regulator